VHWRLGSFTRSKQSSEGPGTLAAPPRNSKSQHSASGSWFGLYLLGCISLLQTPAEHAPGPWFLGFRSGTRLLCCARTTIEQFVALQPGSKTFPKMQTLLHYMVGYQQAGSDQPTPVRGQKPLMPSDGAGASTAKVRTARPGATEEGCCR
jgi:hypothetical protein